MSRAAGYQGSTLSIRLKRRKGRGPATMTSRTASIGWWVEFSAAILKQMPRPEEIDQTTADAWCQNQKDLKRVLAEALLSIKKEVIIATNYKVAVDPSMTFEKLIKACNFESVEYYIRKECFFRNQVGFYSQQEIELVLVHLNRDAKKKEVLEYMNREGLKPAGLGYLLALAMAHPNLQKQFVIIALGTEWTHGLNHNSHSPCLDFYNNHRRLALATSDEDTTFWDYRRFLAIRKAA